ncbi:MAG: hypothetical protein ABIH42_02335 [Planctomycetota bacterium]
MRQERVFLFLCICLSLVLFPVGAFSQEPVHPGDVRKAIERGVEFLKTQQASNGSWDYTDTPFKLAGSHYVEGCTWLVVYAMVKAGINPKESFMQNAINYARSNTRRGDNLFCHIYCVSCMVLAIEAMYMYEETPEKKDDKGYVTRLIDKEERADKFAKKVSPEDKKLLEEGVQWLIKYQDKNVWRYPGGDGTNVEDASNTQYAMLALSAARRLKVPVPAEVFQKVAEYFVFNQEKEGTEVPWFPVPAADMSFKELKKIEKEVLQEIRKINKKYEKEYKKAVKKGKEPPSIDEFSTDVIEEAQKKISTFGGEKKKIFARGWCYMWNDTSGSEWRVRITGSMTTSGIASLAICKEALEESTNISPVFLEKISTALRDGCGWIAKHWSVTGNPAGVGGSSIHHHYYLYGLERAGTLALIPKYGEHIWYEEGVEHLLRSQRANGCWDAASGGTSGPIPDTCWAILFICKATTPLVQIPEQIYTGENLLNPKKK